VLFLLIAIPLIALALASAGKDDDFYAGLYRLAPDDPDRWTPDERQFDPGLITMGPDFRRFISETVTTPDGNILMPGMAMEPLLKRYSEGDWGNVSEAQAAQNDAWIHGESTGGIVAEHSIEGSVGGEVGSQTVYIETDYDEETGRNETLFSLPPTIIIHEPGT